MGAGADPHCRHGSEARAEGATRTTGDLHGNVHVRRKVGGFIITERVYPPTLTIDRHDHERASLCVVLAGAYDESFGRRTRRAEPGIVIVHPAGEHHAEMHDPVQTRLLIIEVEPAHLQELRPVVHAFDEAWHRKDDSLISFAYRLRFEAGRADPSSSLCMEAALMEMLGSIDAMSTPEARRSSWLFQVRDRLEADAADVPTLEQLSRLAGVHPVHLARTFRRTFGCTIGSYVRRLRVGKAMTMLEIDDLSLSSLAYEAGFSDQSHMSRLVRAHTGLPPGVWRRRAKRQP